MFIEASTLVLAFVALVNAVPQPNLAVRTSGDTNQCNTGSIQCCTSSGLEQNPITGLLELQFGGCSPISILGLGSASDCEANPVCCNNDDNDMSIVNCSPITLNF